MKMAYIDNENVEVVDIDELYRRANMNSAEGVYVCHGNTLYMYTKKLITYKPIALDHGFALEFISNGQEHSSKYSADKIVDFDQSKTFADIIRNQDKMSRAESTTLSIINKDNILIPIVDPNDDPALRGIKEALGKKKIDPDAYKQRLGADFSNNMRLITNRSNHSITLKKMKALCDAFDLDIHITLSDKTNAANPMGEM